MRRLGLDMVREQKVRFVVSRESETEGETEGGGRGELLTIKQVDQITELRRTQAIYYTESQSSAAAAMQTYKEENQVWKCLFENDRP